MNVNNKKLFIVHRFLDQIGKLEFSGENDTINFWISYELIDNNTPWKFVQEIRKLFTTKPGDHTPIWHDDRFIAKVVKALLVSLSPRLRRQATDYLLAPFLKADCDCVYPWETSRENLGYGIVIGILQASCWLERPHYSELNSKNISHEDSKYFSFVLDRMTQLIAALSDDNTSRAASLNLLSGQPVKDQDECCQRLRAAAECFATGIDEQSWHERQKAVEKLRLRLIASANTVGGKADTYIFYVGGKRYCTTRWSDSAEIIIEAFINAVRKDMPLFVRLFSASADPKTKVLG